MTSFDSYELKIYNVLFRCYETQNMRKEVIEIADICARKYVVDRVRNNEEVSEDVVSDVGKLLWIAIVK